MLKFSSMGEIAKRRWILLFVAVITAIIQHTPGLNLKIGTLSPMLLVSFTVCVAMYERSITGLFYGLVAGALWDFASSGADGMYTLMLTTIGFAVGIAVTLYVRNRLVSALVLSLGSCTAVSVAYWLVFILRKGYEGSWALLFTHFLPLAVYSSVFVVVYYYLVGFIIKATAVREESRLTYVRVYSSK